MCVAFGRLGRERYRDEMVQDLGLHQECMYVHTVMVQDVAVVLLSCVWPGRGLLLR